MKRLLFIIVLFPLLGSAQIISTFAGNGTNTNSGDGGPAINAGIYNPTWGIFDKWFNYYVLSGPGHKVRKIDSSGVISTYAGTGSQGYNGDGGLADTSKLDNPGSITLDSLGNLFIADGGNHRVRKVNRLTGIITTSAGTGIAGFTGDGGLATAAELNSPNDMCFDKKGNLYISDLLNYRIRKVDTDGIITTYAGTGIGGYNGDNIPALSANLTTVRSIAIDDTGNLYLVELSNSYRIRKIDTNGIITTVAGTGIPTYNGDDISAIAANINAVRVAFDQQGFLYISDFGNKRIRKVDANGIIHTIAGNGAYAYAGDGGPADSASLNGPSGITFDSCGNLYITEVNQGRIRKVTYNPDCSPVDTTAFTQNIAATGSIGIYPNPAMEELRLSAGAGATEVMIINALGQVLLRPPYGGNKSSINISSLQPGLYYLLITDAKTGRTERLKFLKE